MSASAGDQVPPVPELPPSLWAFGASFVVGQVIELLERGPQDESSWVLSILFGVVLVTFFSHGVVRARPIRFWIVVVLVCLGALLGAVGLITDPSAWDAAAVVVSVAQAFLIFEYKKTDWFAWQQTRPQGGPSLVPILAVAVLVGALGGVVGAANTGDVATSQVG